MLFTKKTFFCFFLMFSLLFSEEVFQYGNKLEFFVRIDTEDAEITAYMPTHKKLFSIGGNASLSVYDFSKPQAPQIIQKIKLQGEASSISVYNDLVALALISERHTDPGKVLLYRYQDSLELYKSIEVCAEPDMLSFGPHGDFILVACEASPSKDGSIDPEGQVAYIDLSQKPQVQTHILDFRHLDSTSLLKKGVRVSGPANFYQNLEPEYIAIDSSGQYAWVSLQENNAIALIDIHQKKITEVFPLGTLDHSLASNSFDAQKDKKAKLIQAPVLGMRQPDGIAVHSKNNKHYVFTANEGASKKESYFTDETNIQTLVANNALSLKSFTPSIIESLEKLIVSKMDTCKNQSCEKVYSFGSRSMSVLDGKTGKILFDSQNQIETLLAKIAPSYFNWNAKKGKKKTDTRSHYKGPEPENITIGTVKGKNYAFLGLERMSGILVWDIENPENPSIIDYYLNPKDRGPEGILFIPEKSSPIPGTPLLVVAYEYSESIVVYTFKK